MNNIQTFSCFRNLFLVALVLVLPLTGNAQSPTFRFALAPSQGDPPAPRLDAPPVYDPAGRQILIFGGRGRSALNDLWAYSISTGRWMQMNPSGGPPPPRFGHTVIFDAARRRLIVFGGQAGGFFSDVWAFEIAENSWRLLAPEDAGPSSRYGHSAIYDPTGDRMVISHG